MLLPAIQHLTERQQQLFFLFHTAIARHTPDGFTRLIDDDVSQSAGALASTLETASKGVIYEHKAASTSAQRLASELTALLEEIRKQGATVSDAEATLVLRAIEEGARSARRHTTGGETAYLGLMSRLLQMRRSTPSEPSPAPSTVIIP